MVIDLIMLAIIGCVLEGLCTKMVGLVILGLPTATISLLIIFVAIVRWNLWGLTISPLLALSTIIGGKFSSFEFMTSVYGVELYFAIFGALLVVGLDVIMFKKYGTKKCVNEVWKLILFVIFNFLAFHIVQNMLYRTFTCGNPFSKCIENVVVPTSFEKDGYINIHQLVENSIVYNLFGLAAAIVGVIVLRSQGVVNNVRDKLIDDKKQAELDRTDTENFTLSVEEESNSEKMESELRTNDDSENSINKDGV